MSDLTTAAAAEARTAIVTSRRCPVCRGRLKKVAACNRCHGKGSVELCSVCYGAGLVNSAGAPRGFVYCGRCGGTGLEPPSTVLAGNSAQRAAAKRKGVAGA